MHIVLILLFFDRTSGESHPACERPLDDQKTPLYQLSFLFVHHIYLSINIAIHSTPLSWKRTGLALGGSNLGCRLLAVHVVIRVVRKDELKIYLIIITLIK